MLSGLLMTTAQNNQTLTGVGDVEFVAWVTGPNSLNKTDENYHIAGTDLGSMFDLNGTLYISFGDTFGCCRPKGGAFAPRRQDR